MIVSKTDRKRTLLGYLMVITAIASLCIALSYRSQHKMAELRYQLDEERQQRLHRILSREKTITDLKAMLEHISANGCSSELAQPLQLIDQFIADIKEQHADVQREVTLEKRHGHN
ncbi:hypothetical protein KBJ94_27975 [Pseudomonas sp. ITA]|uniref:hypothetical protein n=1 Tax=Pseudomonas sp. ITA TaxID=2825841 RepID=UPI002499A57A|nr:hypothetical protein [Pseudomonas sp. ITA]MDI2145887.1 hypothetical protein [Pseudomonas sp. ITA]